ncbi:MAG: GDP-mannose 4,6-dehydratase [bacterium]|nr:GDP-mannose 4,6-dehydratase [bacterium]
MKVLVTGGAGFIGSHLCDLLISAGHHAVAFDDLSTGTLENVAHLSGHPLFSFVRADIRDARAVEGAMASCDAVVHLAARIGLKIIVESPLETIEVNARGTETVLEVASRRRVRTIVASTSEVYGHSTRIPSAESDPICFGSPTIGRWSYACAKAYDEFYALALHQERGLPAIVVRLFNTVGPRQTGRYGMVIPRFVTQALAGEPLTVYGDGTQTRCFCSVDDVVGALLAMLERSDVAVGQVFNIGNPEETSIESLAKLVIEMTGSASGIRYVPFSDAYPVGFEEIMRRVPNIDKARELLGFSPRSTLRSILDDVIASVDRRERTA